MESIDKLTRLFAAGKLSRREFIARMSAMGAAAMLPGFLSSRPAFAAPKKGGRLRMGLPGAETGDTIDPAQITNLMPETLGWILRNCLVEIDHNSQAIPELATSWDSTPDAKTWTFKLREGVEFHNGKTMDAEDVLFSIRHHMGKDSKSPAKVIVDEIEELKADGPNTVVFTLKSGNADFPYLMSDYHLTIMPNGTTDFDKGMGTGGYSLVEFEPGVGALAKRFPNYFKPDRAHFDEVQIVAINDVNARTTALQTGQVDVIGRCDRKTLRLLEKSPNVQIVETNGTKHFTMPMNCGMKPYDNNDVRLAMKYAIDREQVLKTVLRGRGILGNDHPISPTNRYFASELPQRQYDPEKAKFHMKKSGVADQTFTLSAADAAFPGAVDVATLFREQAAKAGINVKVQQIPNDGYWSNVWMKVGFCFSYWWGRPTEDWMFSTTYASTSNWNEAHWHNEKFDKLLKEARAELDQEKRRAMYVEMQSICRDEGGSIIPVFPSDNMAATKKLEYDKVASNIEMDGCKLAERWWFA